MKKSLLTIFVLLTSLLNTNKLHSSTFSEISEGQLNYTIYNDDDDAIKNSDELGNNRDISTINIIPSTWFTDGNLIFKGVISITNMKIFVQDSNGNNILTDNIQILKDEITSISLPTSHGNTYYIIVIIGEESFIAEFTN